jgi:hypothetical protein
MVENIVINDFEFIIGLDGFYRNNMMKYESDDLLPLLEKMVKQLNICLDDVEIEGYYYLTKELKKYFKIVKNLKNISIDKIEIFKEYNGYNKLIDIFCSDLYGEYKFDKYIIPSVNDILNQALKSIDVNKYNYEIILEYAYKLLQNKKKITLVELGILKKDPIIVTALRESAALYVDVVIAGDPEPVEYNYTWNVSKEIENAGNEIINTFNKICPYKIPYGSKENAEIYYNEFTDNKINNRCIRIAEDDNGLKYHWAIKYNYYTGKYKFEEFWDKKLWTSEKYKNKIL